MGKNCNKLIASFKNTNNAHHNKNNNNHVFDVILTSNALKSMLAMLMESTHYGGYTHSMCVRSYEHYDCYCCLLSWISIETHLNPIFTCNEMRKLWSVTHPISFRHRNSCKMRLGWLVGIRCLSANSRLFGRCSWHLKDVRNTVLKVPSPIRRWILKMLSTSGIWDFKSATSSAIACIKISEYVRVIAMMNEIAHGAHAQKHIAATCLNGVHLISTAAINVQFRNVLFFDTSMGKL